MKLAAVLFVLLLTGCVAPAKREFPSIPPSLSKPCRDLVATPETNRLSTVLEVVTDNYALYRECQIKSQTWLEWYAKQKEIFDSVK